MYIVYIYIYSHIPTHPCPCETGNRFSYQVTISEVTTICFWNQVAVVVVVVVVAVAVAVAVAILKNSN